MIWIYIFCGIVIAAAGLVIALANQWISISANCVGVIMVVAAIAIVLLCIAGGEQLTSHGTNSQNIQEYETLLLYRDVVSDSHDELLRWDYYQRIQEWNDQYVRWTFGRNSNWTRAFYGAHDYDQCDIIDFSLRRN